MHRVAGEDLENCQQCTPWMPYFLSANRVARSLVWFPAPLGARVGFVNFVNFVIFVNFLSSSQSESNITSQCMPPQRMHAITVQQCMPSQCMPQIYSNARVFAKNQWGLGVSSSRNGVSGSRGGFFPGMVFSVPGKVFVVPTKVCLVPTVFWVPAWVFWVPTNLRSRACSEHI